MTVEELQIVISAKIDGVLDKVQKVKEKVADIQPKKAADVDVTTNKAQGNLKKLQAEIDRTQAKISELVKQKQGISAKKASLRESMVPDLWKSKEDMAAWGAGKKMSEIISEKPQMQAFDTQLGELDAKMAPLQAHINATKAKIASVGTASAETAQKMASAGTAASAASAKTEQLGRNMKTAGGHIRSAGNSSSYFSRMVSRMLLSMALYRGIEFVTKSISEGFQNMALGSSQANSTMSQLASSALYLQNSIAAALMPALKALTPVIVQVADGISWLANQVAIFIAQITDQKTVTIAQKAYVDYAKSLNKAGDNAGEASKKVKELQRTIMGFDELNVLNKNVNDALSSPKKPDAPDYGSMFKTIKTPPSNFNKKDWQKAFDWFKDGSDKAGKALDRIRDKAKEVSKAFGKIPALNPIIVPGMNLGEFDRSKKKYQQPVQGPAVCPGYAPALNSNAYQKSRSAYQKPVNAPLVRPAFAPAMVLTAFRLSIDVAKSNLSQAWDWAKSSIVVNSVIITSRIGEFGSSVRKAFATAGNNVMSNVEKTFDYIPKAVGGGLNAAGKGLSSWLTSSGNGIAAWGNSLVDNVGKTMSSWYTSFVSGLSSAWNQFTGFMKGVGKNIGNWWDANKSWAAPAAIGIAAVGITIATIATGGAAAPAYALLASGGLATGPTNAIIGEGRDHEAVLPLNDTVYSRIGKGIRDNGGDSGGMNTEKIIEHLDALGEAIQNMKLALYTDDRTIAESANRGNVQISKRYHRVVPG